MSADARRMALERRHAELEAELQTLMSIPSPDQMAAVAVKREKLRVKDELTRLTG
ncbi:MAG: YdcH family protein [Pseudomonadota bacterium]